MTLLKNSDWYDIARQTNWTPKYVTENELFPVEMSDCFDIPREAWEAYDEPYKVTYREYVKGQREKDTGAYSVKAAMGRMNFLESAEPGWKSILKSHYGNIPLQEYAAGMAEAIMVRFGRAPGMRNMATFGLLDEVRHAQIQLFFPHEYVSKDRQFDWAQKTMHTNSWVAVANRVLFSDIMNGRDASAIALMLTFSFETAFTNVQFLGLSADAATVGDATFSNLMSTIQTDEARHAQIGAPALKLIVENGGKEKAQKLIDIAFWRNWRVFSVLTGTAMDYYTPLEKRELSFKEFMLEWVVGQFERNIRDVGLDVPWYWDLFLEELNTVHHGYHIGVWYWRPTVWWDPAAGVSTDERNWLEEKYPGWNDSYGKIWDVIGDNIRNGREDLTVGETLPILCNMSGLPLIGIPGKLENRRDYNLDYKGRRYHFGSIVDRWIFEQEPERYAGQTSLIDKFVAGEIQPATLEGFLDYMKLEPGDHGKDAYDYAWAWDLTKLKIMEA